MRCSPRSQTESREALPALLAMPRTAHERSTHRAEAEGSETRKDVAGLGLLTIVKPNFNSFAVSSPAPSA